MKKILSLILAVLCLVMLSACGINDGGAQNNAKPAYIVGEVIEIYESSCLIEVTDEGNYGGLPTGTPVYITTKVDNCPEYVIGDYLHIEFDGTVAESYPPQILHVLHIKKWND